MATIDRMNAAPVVSGNGDYPAGAMENGLALIDRVENNYKFECEGGPLRMNADWHDLQRCFRYMVDYIQGKPAPVVSLAGDAGPFQPRVDKWMQACFGPEISADKVERNHRFLEEALELVQANGCTQSEAHQLVDYVYGRPVGELPQEVGGVMVTLAALCLASGVDMAECGETELARIWTKVEKIRAKQAAKPKHSPLPEAHPPAQATTDAGGGDVINPLTETERKALQQEAEYLWKDLQSNNLGGYSGINRPFYIMWKMKEVIEQFGNRNVGLHHTQAEIDAAAQRPQTVPDGMVMVPVEPTEAMCEAMQTGLKDDGFDNYEYDEKRGYRAMLKAAAQQQGGAE